jgi:hypothetical protein
MQEARSMHKSLTNARNTFFVLNLLAKYNLLNTRTERLSGKVIDLCKYIFGKVTKWNDLDEIGKIRSLF